MFDEDYGGYLNHDSMKNDLVFGSSYSNEHKATISKEEKREIKVIVYYDVENFLKHLNEQGIDFNNVYEILKSNIKDKEKFEKEREQISSFIGREDERDKYLILSHATKQWTDGMSEEEKSQYLEIREKSIDWRDQYMFDAEMLTLTIKSAEEKDRSNSDMQEFHNMSRELNEREYVYDGYYKLDHKKDKISEFYEVMENMDKTIEKIKNDTNSKGLR